MRLNGKLGTFALIFVATMRKKKWSKSSELLRVWFAFGVYPLLVRGKRNSIMDELNVDFFWLQIVRRRIHYTETLMCISLVLVIYMLRQLLRNKKN